MGFFLKCLLKELVKKSKLWDLKTTNSSLDFLSVRHAKKWYKIGTSFLKKLIITALFVNNLHTVTDSLMTTMQGDGLFH